MKARQGDKIRTTSQPNKTEWVSERVCVVIQVCIFSQFNVALPDMKDVLIQLKEHCDPAYPQDGRPVCVEISVDTAEVGLASTCCTRTIRRLVDFFSQKIG